LEELLHLRTLLQSVLMRFSPLSFNSKQILYTGFEVLTAVVMKHTIWDITPCSLLKVNQRLNILPPSSVPKTKPNKKPA
jgi:hypothetical protein